MTIRRLTARPPVINLKAALSPRCRAGLGKLVSCRQPDDAARAPQ
jgi:hypothetical protein